ncbi:ATP-dependent DNA helicase PIF1-like [Chenopodium quinoa]|uniref:ATP-dependent DNA helicase PIF1-like n=1 Tax=Chenopodium quinoa TaxID=63459 RepID=UPI000B76E70A|nr:ATP-dependent DNA helicase PIF1-like [Chenopodium quinoa]
MTDTSQIIIRSDPNQDQRTHNAPTTSQVAAIWLEDAGSSAPLERDIVVRAHSGVNHHIWHYYGCYDPLQYPLLFPYGQTGWHQRIYRYKTKYKKRQECPTFPINEVLVQTVGELLEDEEQGALFTSLRKKVSCREYNCYRLQIRIKDSSFLLRCGRLLQQFIVDITQRRRLGNRNERIEEEIQMPIRLEEINVVELLNDEQKLTYNTIYNKVLTNKPAAFFVDGPGGTGKTFLYSTLLANVRAKGMIALVVASSGIAALGLSGGRTANSRFKIPLDVDEIPSFSISKQSSLGQLIRLARLIVWDEVPMAKRQTIEYFDRLLQDVCSNQQKFGGNVVVFGGDDFRQVLPVAPKGSLREVVATSFVMSPLWHGLQKIHLTQNMGAINDLPFCKFVLQIENGTPPYEVGKNIELPKPLVIPYYNEHSSLHLLVNSIYPDIANTTSESFFATKRAILIPKNEHAATINSLLVQQQPGKAYEYRSFDGCTDDSSEQYPTEFLNSLFPSGLSPYHLTLKVGSPIILLRNIDPTPGLCNGTRLVCKEFFPNVIDAEIIVGHRCGERVFIPRIPLQPSAMDKYPFRFTRKQFPINLSFAMTINKSQGQTLDRVGIYLPQPVFSHGQLYVALSRAKKSKHVQILIKPTTDELDGWKRTKNVVQIIVQNNIMATQQLTLARLTYQSRNFTVTAKLIKKHPPKKSRSGTTNLQQLIFEDSENTQMKVVIFERDIELYRNLLLEGKEYNITNSIITRTPETFTG